MDWALPWGGQSVDNLLALFQTQVNGYRSVISLEHDGFSYSEAVAPRVLDILTTANVNIGTISQCLGLPSSYGGILDSYLSKCSKNGWLGDDNNCGVCGNACGRQGYCDQGQCFCNADGGYVGDNNNCGACGKKCPKNTTCKGSVCA
ncbi:hypothetical protein BCR33DRAFT_696743 [Rhizoclosmatium globosum]|uniref:Uncharacterized protein n=1 Tax=Rhizoclosmatium globosum TaxID=329046 RepID=A0A1Y2CID4_9FUNG|nr:hypothetical protein BCR33DRAFT_696743 [Rhizoclosmatium globosum]|eukprot:ORY46584.1 hypothetical protein BCR33DRAFT_696743 [Rhizoclosmatium globosum]